MKHEYAVADPQFARTMGNLLGPAIRNGNHVETLLNGDQIFPAMLDAIRHAQRTVDLETYIYWSGTIGQEFTNALIERSKAGVRCNVLLDWLGSGRIDHKFLKAMGDAGVHVVEYHPVHLYDPSTLRQLDHRTHRKVMVVDGKIGFTGGVGIADEWRGNADSPDHWRDNHYRVTGPIVGELQGVFADNWMETSGEVLQGDDYFPALADAGGERAQVFKSSSNGGAESMELLFLLSLTAATKDVRIQSAYFVPGPAAIEAILAARKRGVRVQILVPGGKIDEKIVRKASRATWGPLLRAGVEIAEYQPTMMHCKLMIIDDLWVSIGSSNFDNRSFRLNDEANLNVLDPTFAAGQIQVFEADRKKAKPITYEAWKHRPLKEKVMEGMAWLVSWEL
jgi:cardiolipin synthase